MENIFVGVFPRVADPCGVYPDPIKKNLLLIVKLVGKKYEKNMLLLRVTYRIEGRSSSQNSNIISTISTFWRMKKVKCQFYYEKVR